jgi:NTE family protein
MWHPTGREPETIFDVMDRYKDIQFASRLNNQIARQLETHRLRHIISELAKQLPPDKRADNAVREMTAYGCTTRMHVVQLLAQRLDNERPMKEMDFSPASIRARWQAGHADASQALARTDWLGDFSPLEGVILHQAGPRDDREPTNGKLTAAAE